MLVSYKTVTARYRHTQDRQARAEAPGQASHRPVGKTVTLNQSPCVVKIDIYYTIRGAFGLDWSTHVVKIDVDYTYTIRDGFGQGSSGSARPIFASPCW